MTINTERFRKIQEQIEREPESLDMVSWEDHRPPFRTCGTTRCVAGWAVFNETGQPLFTEQHDLSGPTLLLAAQLGIPEGFHRVGSVVSAIAEKLLGLDEEDAETLFHSVPNGVAVKIVAAFARGDERGGRNLLSEYQ
ncbi:MAG TPA: hypothetical protein VJQ57_13940 [Acidimicrobiia bacterium]|nr:hypothetical protein [Acidimicrobiia bacterium]